jgi:hypothetical protein
MNSFLSGCTADVIVLEEANFMDPVLYSEILHPLYLQIYGMTVTPILAISCPDTSQMATPASNRELLDELPADIKELEFECHVCHDYVHYLMARHCYNCLKEDYIPDAFSICLHCWVSSPCYCPRHRARPLAANILALAPVMQEWIDKDWFNGRARCLGQ